MNVRGVPMLKLAQLCLIEIGRTKKRSFSFFKSSFPLDHFKCIIFYLKTTQPTLTSVFLCNYWIQCLKQILIKFYWVSNVTKKALSNPKLILFLLLILFISSWVFSFFVDNCLPYKQKYKNTHIYTLQKHRDTYHISPSKSFLSCS